MTNKDLSAVPPLMLDWFAANARDLPWRDKGEGRPDPYRVWLCEIMMQQTTIPHGTPYFLKFIDRWPTVEALAEARDEDVMSAWAGLGYYARARNLLKCAREVAAGGGEFPETAEELRKLPGIGPYTAGAIAAIAFDQRVAAVDGNVERVFARLLALKGEWKAEKKHIGEVVHDIVPVSAPGDFAESLMDLGATICTPKSPNCLICPLTKLCLARAEGQPDRFPIKPAKKKQPIRRGHVYLLTHKGDILLERRPETGLLGGMLGLPTSDWNKGGERPDPAFPAEAEWTRASEVRHVFTHFALELDVWQGELNGQRPPGEWRAFEVIDGLPTVFAKAFKLLAR